MSLPFYEWLLFRGEKDVTLLEFIPTVDQNWAETHYDIVN